MTPRGCLARATCTPRRRSLGFAIVFALLALSHPAAAAPPTVAITGPSSGAWTGNSIHVVATASDDVGVTSLKLYGNGGIALQKSCNGTTCTIDDWWVTGSLAAGAYEMNAVAIDVEGN